MTGSASKDRERTGARAGTSASSPEPPAPEAPPAPPSVRWRRDLATLPTPHYLCVTPLWFRLFIAGMIAFAIVMVSCALATALFGSGGSGDPGGSLPITISGVLGLFVGGLVVRALKPLDWREWIRFAMTRQGLYFPGRGVVFVPWSAVGAIDVERWYAKREHSAARLTLTLDDESWSRFSRLARIDGKGPVRRLSIIGIDLTGEEIAARIKACRDDSPAARR